MIAEISDEKDNHILSVAKHIAIVERPIIVYKQVFFSGLCFPLIDGVKAKVKLKQAIIITTSCQIILPSYLQYMMVHSTCSPSCGDGTSD